MDLFDKTLSLIAQQLKGLPTLIVGGAVLRRHFISETPDIDVWIRSDNWEEEIQKRVGTPDFIFKKRSVRAYQYFYTEYLPVDYIREMTAFKQEDFYEFYDRAMVDPTTNLKFATIRDVLRIKRSANTTKHTLQANRVRFTIDNDGLTI